LAFLKDDTTGNAMNEKLLPQEWPAGAVFTVGHSTLPIERFVALLHTFGIEQLVDIRTVPRSRHGQPDA
jgi:hypothetical protein